MIEGRKQMKNRFFVVLMLAGLNFNSTTAYCEGDGLPSVAYLSHMNDVIIVGTGSVGSRTEQSATIDIHVSRVIKGKDVQSDLSIPLQIASPMCSVAKDAAPVTAIWFLRYAANGQLVFGVTPKSQSCHPLASEYVIPEGGLDTQWSYPETLDAKDKLAYELAAAAYASNGKGPAVFSINRAVLETATDKTSLDIGRKLSISSNEDRAMLGRLDLVGHGDPTQLQFLSSNVASLSTQMVNSTFSNQVAHTQPTSPGPTYEGLIAKSIERINKPDTATVQQLGNLLNTPSASLQIRLAAARALRNLHTPLAVTLLGPLLWNTNRGLRAEAIAGVACFANGMPIIDYSSPMSIGIDLNQSGPYKSDATVSHFTMGTQTIAKNEAFYLDFWQQWWTTNGVAISSDAKSMN